MFIFLRYIEAVGDALEKRYAYVEARPRGLAGGGG